MKKAAVLGIPGIQNYDIKSAHPTFLRRWFERAGVGTTWLDEYQESGKEAFARHVGVSVNTWKKMLYATFFQASLHTSFGRAVDAAQRRAKRQRRRGLSDKVELGTIARAVVDEGGDPEATYRRAYDLLRPLRDGIRRWVDYLLGEWFDDHKHETTDRNGKRRAFAKNSCGVRFYPANFRAGRERRAKACAWALQGDEAAFIHVTTLLGAKYGYVPLSNEHDGLLTLRTIPEAAVREARTLTGLHGVKLVEKAIAKGFEAGTYADLDTTAQAYARSSEPGNVAERHDYRAAA
jgi:hypothetical protein